MDGLDEPKTTKANSAEKETGLDGFLKKLKLESKASCGGRKDSGLNNEGDGDWRKGWVRER